MTEDKKSGDVHDSLTRLEAYSAMFAFLDFLYQQTKSDALGSLLGGMSFVDGKSADPAVWGDWEEAVRKVRDGEVDIALRPE